MDKSSFNIPAVPNLSSTVSVDPNPEQERLLAAIQSKIASQNIVLKPTQESDVVVDLLEALQSVRINKGENKVAATKEIKRGTPNEKLG